MKPQLIVNGSPVTSISIPADGVTYVQAVVSSPSKPNMQYSVTMDSLCPLDRSTGILNGQGQAIVTFGPSRMRGRITGRVSVTPGPNLNISVEFV